MLSIVELLLKCNLYPSWSRNSVLIRPINHPIYNLWKLPPGHLFTGYLGIYGDRKVGKGEHSICADVLADEKVQQGDLSVVQFTGLAANGADTDGGGAKMCTSCHSRWSRCRPCSSSHCWPHTCTDHITHRALFTCTHAQITLHTHRPQDTVHMHRCRDQITHSALFTLSTFKDRDSFLLNALLLGELSSRWANLNINITQHRQENAQRTLCKTLFWREVLWEA